MKVGMNFSKRYYHLEITSICTLDAICLTLHFLNQFHNIPLFKEEIMSYVKKATHVVIVIFLLKVNEKKIEFSAACSTTTENWPICNIARLRHSTCADRKASVKMNNLFREYSGFCHFYKFRIFLIHSKI